MTLRKAFILFATLLIAATFSFAEVPGDEPTLAAPGDDPAIADPSFGRGLGPHRRGGRAAGAGLRRQGGCQGPEMDAVATVTGTVIAYEGGPDHRLPTLTLAVEDDWLEIAVGPNRLWAGTGLEPAAGETLEVTYAPAPFESHLVAISVRDPEAGTVLALRDPASGRPLAATGGEGGSCRGCGGGRCGRCGRCGRG